MIPHETIEAKKHDPKRGLDRVFTQAEAQGMPINFNGQTYHLQLRPVDRTNWLGVREDLRALAPADTYTIMTEEDVPITTDVATIDAWLVNALSYFKAIIGARWAIKNAIAQGAITDIAQVKPAFDNALQSILNPAP